jgi:hypothetical protein
VADYAVPFGSTGHYRDKAVIEILAYLEACDGNLERKFSSFCPTFFIINESIRDAIVCNNPLLFGEQLVVVRSVKAPSSYPSDT